MSRPGFLKNSGWTAIVAVTSFLMGSATIGAFALADAAPPVESTPVPEPAPASVAPIAEGDAFAMGFTQVSDAVVPSVVRIETRRTMSPQTPMSLFNLPFDGPDQSAPQLSGGTGFVVSGDGYVLTNNHVVDDAEAVTVWLHDRRSFEAEIVGTDPTTDVAVLKIDAGDLPALAFGDSDELRIGEWVVAVGNPGFGGARSLDETVTAGIVSAMGRPLPVIQQGLARNPDATEIAPWAIEDFIQTDAVINPGNSGGPLVDLSGRVVGMNTAIASASGYYQGYGFAIPSDLVREVMDDLIEYGAVRRALLGVQVTDVSAEDADIYGLPGISGALVQEVTVDGPAERAGLQREDVIVEVNGDPIDRGGQLQHRIARLEPGEDASIMVYRDGRQIEIAVELGEVPMSAVPERRAEPARTDASTLLGLEFRPLDARIAERLGFDVAEGILVTGVDPRGPAARKGIPTGAKVTTLNGIDVETMDDLEAALEGVESGSVVRMTIEDAAGNSRIVNLRARR